MKTTDTSSLGIGAKLIIGLGTLIGISALVGSLAILSMLSIQGTSTQLSAQYLPEVLLAGEVERNTQTLMLDVRGYTMTFEASYYQKAIEDQDKLKASLASLQDLSGRSPDLKELAKNLPLAQAAQKTYEGLIAESKTATDVILNDRVEMDAAAKAFEAAIVGYIENQHQSLASDLRTRVNAAGVNQRVDKIDQGNRILNLGNAVRIANFKAQAYRDPKHLQAVMGNFDTIAQTVSALLKITTQQVNKDQLALVSASTSDYRKAVQSWLDTTAQMDQLAVKRLAAANELSGLAEKTSRIGVETSQKMATGNATLVSAASWTIIIGLIASIALGVVVAFILIRSITGPLSLVTSLSRKVTRGDFAIDRTSVKSKDELGLLTESFYDMVEGLKAKANLIESIAGGVLTNNIPLASEDDGLGRSLQRMQESLNEILTQVNVAVDQMASGSDQVSTAAQSLSQGATEQASSLEEISASATEIHSQSKQNAENAMTANQLAKQASQSAQQGNQQMKDLMQLLEKMTKSSEETKTIVKTIDDIAFQVNLLALNANVEAARAGKYGKGFAVVAEEVRNLAVRSAAAVNETTRMVEESIRNIQDVNDTALKTGDQLNGILGNANKVADFLEEIAASSQEQARSMGQINGGLDQIDQVTQSNTASAEESASASEELSGQAQQLKVMVSRFQLSDEALQKAQSRVQAANHGANLRSTTSAPPAGPVGKPGPAGPKKAGGTKAAPPQDIILNEDFDTF